MGSKLENEMLEQLYRSYYDSLMIIACSYTHNEESAKDLVQTVFLKASVSYEPRGSFLFWCNKVMRNEFYTLLRRNKMRADEDLDSLDLRSQDDVLSSYIHNEERARLAAMISMLPLKYREVMIDSVYLQMDDDEIAEMRGLTRANLRQIRSRARKMLIEMKEAEDDRYR